MGDQYLCMRDEAEWKSLRAGQSIEMSMMRAFKILWTTKQDLAAMVSHCIPCGHQLNRTIFHATHDPANI